MSCRAIPRSLTSHARDMRRRARVMVGVIRERDVSEFYSVLLRRSHRDHNRS